MARTYTLIEAIIRIAEVLNINPSEITHALLEDGSGTKFIYTTAKHGQKFIDLAKYDNAPKPPHIALRKVTTENEGCTWTAEIEIKQNGKTLNLKSEPTPLAEISLALGVSANDIKYFMQ